MGPNNRGVLLPPDSPTELFLEDYFDVELEPWTDVDLYQADQWKTRIASGDIPDYIKTDAIGSGLHDIGAVAGAVRRLPAPAHAELHQARRPDCRPLRLADGDLGRRGGRYPERQRRHCLRRHLRHPPRLGGGGRRAASGQAHARLPLLRLLEPGRHRAPAAQVSQRRSGRQRQEATPTASRSTRTATPSVSTPAPSGHSRTSSARTVCASRPGRRLAGRCSTR